MGRGIDVYDCDKAEDAEGLGGMKKEGVAVDLLVHAGS